MHSPRSTPLQAVRKAIGRQTVLIANSRDARSYRLVTLTALRLAEALLLNGFDLDRVRLAIEAAGGGGGNPLVPDTDQHIASPLVHGPKTAMETEACPETKRIAR